MNNIKELNPKEGVILLAVKVPEGADAWKNESYHINTLWYKTEDIRYPKHIDLPEGNWQLLGTSEQITEDQCSGLFKNKDGYGLSVELPEPNNRVAYFDRKEALISFLEANEVYSVNPKPHPADIETMSIEHYIRLEDNWNKAEANTGTWVLLLKL